MTAKQITFHEQARERMLAGVNTLANAVRVTLGPRGHHHEVHITDVSEGADLVGRIATPTLHDDLHPHGTECLPGGEQRPYPLLIDSLEVLGRDRGNGQPAQV